MTEELRDQMISLISKVTRLEEQMLKVEASVAGMNVSARLRGEIPRRPVELTEIKCFSCGQMATVPFKPKTDRPVYCRDCFEKHRAERRRQY